MGYSVRVFNLRVFLRAKMLNFGKYKGCPPVNHFTTCPKIMFMQAKF